MSEETTIRAVIRGRVQRVGYRDWTVRKARDLGLDGWVRNRRDGTVEAVFRGPPGTVERMLFSCQDGPPAAHVDAVERFAAESADAGQGGFEQRETA